jgi:phage terminase large subunit GpA-like protein
MITKKAKSDATKEEKNTEFPLAFRLAIKPPERMTVAQWADKNRVLDLISSKPGPWRTDFTPYIRADGSLHRQRN